MKNLELLFAVRGFYACYEQNERIYNPKESPIDQARGKTKKYHFSLQRKSAYIHCTACFGTFRDVSFGSSILKSQNFLNPFQFLTSVYKFYALNLLPFPKKMLCKNLKRK